MIVVDSSAVVAILLGEPDATALAAILDQNPGAAMAAANYLETSLVIEGRYPKTGAQAFNAFFATASIDIVPVDREIAERAREAFRAYGKGRHKAGLNFGDCIAYATAKLRGVPLLAKGGDFHHTDVTLAA